LRGSLPLFGWIVSVVAIEVSVLATLTPHTGTDPSPREDFLFTTGGTRVAIGATRPERQVNNEK
jgi:hypothetical protein